MEYQFRIWDSWNQHMTTGHDNAELFRIHEKLKAGENKPVMDQYTNIDDKDGKKIFVNDILSADPGGRGVVVTGFVGVVTFLEGAFWVENRDFQVAYPLFQELDQWVKIGNIHENPELMDGVS